MAERILINEMDAENVVGGALKWLSSGVVYPKNNPDAKYTYTDFYDCTAWLTKHWSGIQDEKCLQAMELDGLVHKIG